ncbi:TonB-dependent receptor [Terriglobus saanensis]|uniref:TonB-dependent receptor plug n=1 Tax=Terriglobus saanensis (strain ATCC BAA-1853 / DSM 23119 / SP1PR4) TaxID=401053 RepID=E8V4L4_TERSS|nr:TonB-dependent receptor [Terriglobus saanensis]ADV84838.1 TonB-dependent receptor plug [Terriglobus saanensis SP1PR4]
MKHLLSARAILAGCLFTMATTVWAQSTTQGAISGTVFDATNAVIPKASVTIHNNGTNADLALTADDGGFFKAPQLPPGTYTVTISSAGFSELKSNQVMVQVNQVTELNPHLTAGASSSVIEVTAETPVLKFDTPAYGGQLSNAEIESIPINNRRWSSLSLLTPGVTNDASGFGLISFRAISATLNNVLIDGADDNQAYFGEERGRTRAGYSTAQTAIREFQVNTGVYSAEFGRAVGGVVNSVTKSGTNAIHGEAYFYHRGDELAAPNPYTNTVVYNTTTGTASQINFKPKDKRNQYGFGIGGPIIKDKLFFFYAFDEFRRNFPGTGRAGNTTFYADPSAADLATLTTRLSNSTGATVTSAQALATYRSFIQSMNTALGPVARYGNQDINTPKLDWQVNGKNHVSVLYHRLRWDSPGGVQTQQSNTYATDSFGTDFVKLDYGLAKLDSIITSHITNELRYQYARELNDEGRQTPVAFTNQFLTPASGIPVQINLPTNAFTMGAPYYSFRAALPDERKWQIGDTASFLYGKHNLKVGLDLLHNYDIQNTLGGSTAPPNGLYTYGTLLGYISDLASPSRGGCGTGTGAAYVPVGCYTNYKQTLGRPNFDVRTIDYGFFAQDDWKLAPTLTLNLGVRYDYEKLPDVILPNAAFPDTLNTPSDKNNISPRLGFAWDPYGLGKTVVRGGYGMYYGHIPNALFLTARSTTGAAGGQNAYTLTPSASAPRLPSTTFTPGGTTTPDIQYLAKNFQNPMAQQFDLAVQQELGMNTVLSVSYLGSLGRELPNSLNLNLDPTKTYTQNYTVTGTGNCGPLACGSSFPVTVYSGATVGGTPTVKNTAANAAYAAISNVNSSFHALTVEVQKRASKYISFDANYTWSHALDFNQNQVTGLGSNLWIDPYNNARANYGNSFLNVPHRVVGWAILNIPGTHGNAILKQATNGWSIKPAFQMQSGLPYSASTNSFTTSNQCAAATCLKPFTTGLGGTGTTYMPILGRNTFQYPRDIVIDLRVQRDFPITERMRFELIGEAFNLANHQNITGINTTAYNVTGTSLTYQSTFGAVQNSNNNYAYNPRNIQIGGRLFF